MGVIKTLAISLFTVTFLISEALTNTAFAAVLPEERIDLFYSVYDADQQEIVAPAILVRKNFADKISIQGHHLVDMVSGASIDVRTLASKYTEERTETSISLDYLHERTIISARFANSEENDYEANTASFNVSQEFFGDLSTLTLGYSQGDDTVQDITRPDFEENVKRKKFRAGLSQILTRHWITALNYESVIDEGYLNNPYRESFGAVRFLDSTQPDGIGNQGELYPGTRNSDAFSIRSMYYLPYRASIKAEYRIYEDSWGIKANSYELRYIHPFGDELIVELKYRVYDQTQADFYSDLFPAEDFLTFRGRDKELSTYSSQNIGVGITYNIMNKYLSLFDKATANLYWDNMQFDYDNFRDYFNSTEAPGQESLFSFDANVIRFYLSFWY